MLLQFSKLKNLSVFTQSGIKLGHVSDIEIDLDSQSIVRYVIKRGIVSRDILLVHRGQVISVTSEKMTVEDAVVKTSGLAKIKEAIVQPVAGLSARQ